MGRWRARLVPLGVHGGGRGEGAARSVRQLASTVAQRKSLCDSVCDKCFLLIRMCFRRTVALSHRDLTFYMRACRRKPRTVVCALFSLFLCDSATNGYETCSDQAFLESHTLSHTLSHTNPCATRCRPPHVPLPAGAPRPRPSPCPRGAQRPRRAPRNRPRAATIHGRRRAGEGAAAIRCPSAAALPMSFGQADLTVVGHEVLDMGTGLR